MIEPLPAGITGTVEKEAPMRKALILCLAFSLAACTNPSASPGWPGGTSPPDSSEPRVEDLKPDSVVTAKAGGDVVQVATNVGKTVMVRGLQGLIIAEEWYQPVNRAALAAVQTGGLPHSVQRKILDLNRTIRSVLDRGKGASDGAGKAAAAAEAMRSIVDLRALVGGPR